MFKIINRTNNSNSNHSAHSSLSSSLKISSPIHSPLLENTDELEDHVPHSNTVTIVVTKFPFTAENSRELTVGIGEALELLDRKPNGWVLVKPIGRIRKPGLIPESYVRIIDIKQLAEKQVKSSSCDNLNISDNSFDSFIDDDIRREFIEENSKSQEQLKKEVALLSMSSSSRNRSNSNLNSLKKNFASVRDNSRSVSSSLESITTSDNKSSDFQNSKTSSLSTSMDSFDFQTSGFKQQLETLDDVETLITSDNSSFKNRAVNGSVKNVSAHNNRYWYRVDLQMLNGDKRFLCRYYQDFYKLHLAIIGKFTDQPDTIESLPVLPEPLPRPDLTTIETILLTRVQQLNFYLFQIINNKLGTDYQDILDDWIVLRETDFDLKHGDSLSYYDIDYRLNPSTGFQAQVQSPIIEISTTNSPASTITPKLRPAERRPTLSVQTSTTPPLPNISTFKDSKLNNISPQNIHSKNITSPLMKSPKLWQSIKSKSYHSEPSQIDSETNSVSTPSSLKSIYGSSFSMKSRDPSSPIKTSPSMYRHNNNSTNSSASGRRASEFKLKIILGNDTFAIRFNNKIQKYQELLILLRNRLELKEDQGLILQYSRDLDHAFVPLVNDKDLNDAFSQEKVLVRAEVV